MLKPLLIGFFLGFAAVGAGRIAEDDGRDPRFTAAQTALAAYDRVVARPCLRPGAYVRVLA